MKEAKKQFAQGDVFFERIDALPEGVREAAPEKGRFTVAHSESGHNHVVDPTQAILFETSDPFIAYLRIADEHADIVHQRSYDTHETVRLSGGDGAVWKVRRQREYTSESVRSAAD
jgi:hypothetical protein